MMLQWTAFAFALLVSGFTPAVIPDSSLATSDKHLFFSQGIRLSNQQTTSAGDGDTEAKGDHSFNLPTAPTANCQLLTVGCPISHGDMERNGGHGFILPTANCQLLTVGCPVSHGDTEQNEDHGFILPTANCQLLAACDLVVDAGPDTNVCFPGGLIGLQGSITGADVFFEWQPASGLNNPFILNPTANITGPITYTLVAWAEDPDNPNLVVNGDFSAGNTGFSSDYNYVVDIPGNQSEMVPEGTYTVINNPNLVHTGFVACSDHTGGNGNMMVVNGAANFLDIWCQTVPVTPGSYYNIAAWVASVNAASPAELQFSINGTPIGDIVNALSTPCVWTPFNAVWNSGSNTTAEICILNLNTAQGGNDFALDDISMIGLCSVEDEVEITLLVEDAPEPDIDGPAFVCEGDIATYTATFPPEPPIDTYQWSIPAGATIITGQGTPEITVQWNQDQVTEICLEIETRCDMNEACFEVEVGTLPDLPGITGDADLCPGETINLYTPEQDPDDIYDWSLPSNVTLISGGGTNEIEIEWAAPGDAEICVAITNACGTTDNCTLLSLHENYNVLFDTLICEGSTFEINGNTYGNGIFSGTEYFVTVHGCDSIVEVEVMETSTLIYHFTETLCPGDSIFLEGAYQFQSGIFIDSFLTAGGCDSIIETQVFFSATDTTLLFSNTCDSMLAGIFISTYTQGNCDSVVIEQIDFIPADTLILISTSCNPSDTGYTIQVLSNIFGCDSIIITDVNFLLSDTTQLTYNSCNPADVGTTFTLLANINGCDSLVIETTLFSLADTTYLQQNVCQIADTGTVETLLINTDGCDSLVITSLDFGGSPTTFLAAATCSIADSGWVYNTLQNVNSCDSLIATYYQWIPSDSTFITLSSCNPQDTGLSIQHLSNLGGCDSTVFIYTGLMDPDACFIAATYSVESPLCYGDPAILTIEIQIGTGPFELFIHGTHESLNYNFISKGVYAVPLNEDGKLYLVLTSDNGLVWEDSITIIFPDELRIDAHVTSDYNGFSIPCFGDQSGAAIADLLSNGTPPLMYEWSTGDEMPSISNLSAGLYTVTVTDANGCAKEDAIEITSPPSLLYELQVEDLSCFGAEDGYIQLTVLSGGVPPILTSLDGSNFDQTFTYTDLEAGAHELMISDQNGCMFNENIVLEEPEDWFVQLAADTTIRYGEEFSIHPDIIGNPQGNLSATWSDGVCPDCLSRAFILLEATTIEVTITDNAGCTSTDEIRIQVIIDRDLFIPNIFTPNNDQINDLVMINAGPSLEEITWFRIYDRWGGLVFSADHFQANDPAFGWNGRLHGELLNPAVFTFQLLATYKDGFQDVVYGNITLLK